MAESVLPYALTTVQRVKDRLTISGTTFDTVLTRMVNSATDFFEKECGNRRFLQTLYTNEVYSATSNRQTKLSLRNAPVTYVVISGDQTAASTTINNIVTAGLQVGMVVMGPGIPSGVSGVSPTKITAVGATSITLSNAASTSVTGNYFTIYGLVAFEWRSGTPSNPNWIAFIIDQYELINDGKAGTIRVYGVIPRLYSNMLRATYWAGYLINWANAGDNVTHTLPSDITDTVENLVVRVWKRRELAGKTNQALEGATTGWRNEIDATDQDVIDHYKRVPTIF